jgi:hypothetical protein
MRAVTEGDSGGDSEGGSRHRGSSPLGAPTSSALGATNGGDMGYWRPTLAHPWENLGGADGSRGAPERKAASSSSVVRAESAGSAGVASPALAHPWENLGGSLEEKLMRPLEWNT